MKKLCSSQSGFTLIEILVTLIILLIGLLGIAALQGKSQQVQVEAYQRSQAMILLKDMANRMSVRNQRWAPSYAITGSDGTPFLGVGHSGTMDVGDTMTDTDLNAWDAALKGAAETEGGQNVGAMIGARGCISRIGTTHQYVISVAWQGLNATVASTDPCASGLYGTNDALRRVASVTIQITAQLRN